jgi:cell wall-associated NlpC family hydrolase
VPTIKSVRVPTEQFRFDTRQLSYGRRFLAAILAFFVSVTSAIVISGDAVSVASQQINKPYSHQPGTGPNNFDCSGLTQYSYANADNPITLKRHSSDQAAQGQDFPGSSSDLPTLVGSGNLQRGDLLFFATDPNQPGVITHVGIFESGSTMINAVKPHDPTKAKIVKRSNLLCGSECESFWIKSFMLAKRLSSPLPPPPPSQISYPISFAGQIVAIDSTPGNGTNQPPYANTYTMSALAVLQDASRGELDLNVVLTYVSVGISPPITGTVPAVVKISLSADASGLWQGNVLGEGWGNLRWLVQATANGSAMTGRLRIHNEFISPWTDPLYAEDTGWVSFTLTR